MAHFSLLLCLLVAVAWRSRSRSLVPGLAIGGAVAIKFFLWPLVVWLAALRRYREAAFAACLGAISLLLVRAYTNPIDYLRMLRELGAAYDQDSYSPYGLAVQAGLSSAAGTTVTFALGLTLIAVAWHRRSLGLFIGASLVLSPIVWLDFYALLAIPLAVVRPRLNGVWLLPIVTWGIASAGRGVGDAGHSIRVLAVFGLLLGYVVWAEGRVAPLAEARGARSPTGRPRQG